MSNAFETRRDIAQRVVIRGLLRLTSPALIGGAKTDTTSDRPVIRDQDGRPYLPGTTLAGLLRHQLSPEQSVELFGPESDDDTGQQSRLLFSDAKVLDGHTIEFREGVAICPAHGVAADKTKYDFEALSVGATFPIALEVLLPDDIERQRSIKNQIGYLLTQLEMGAVRIGSRSSRGFGDFEIVTNENDNRWEVSTYDVRGLDGLLAWMGQQTLKPTYLKSGQEWVSCDLVTPRSVTFEAKLSLKVDGSILVGSGGHGAGEADKAHLSRSRAKEELRESVLPGTSLAGVLRHRCRRIAKTLDKPLNMVDELFGSKGAASKVRVHEVPISGGTVLRHTRVRIDPWTGGAADTALFTQDCQYDGQVEIRITAKRLEPTQRALLLLALRDLAEGQLAVGAQSGAGRGRLTPAREGRFATFNNNEEEAWLEWNGSSISLHPPNLFEEDFKALEGLRNENCEA